MARVGGREVIGIITRDHFVWGFGNVGRSIAIGELGSLSRDSWEGGSRKMALVGGSVGLGTISRYHLVGGFGTVRRTRPKEGLATISRAVWEGRSGNMAGWVGGKE
jgi:hypothetical protein